MKKIVYTLKLGFSRITFSALVEKGRNCVAMLTGNAAFATPVPALAAITAACDRLALANERYGFTRSRLDLAERQTAFAELKALLKELGGYVQAVSEGDKDLILSAGFEVEKQRTPVGELPPPQDLRALVTMYPGILELLWKGVRGRGIYEVWICEGDVKDPAAWSLHALTTKNRLTVEGLKSNSTYGFKVIAQGAAGASPASDVAIAKAA